MEKLKTTLVNIITYSIFALSEE